MDKMPFVEVGDLVIANFSSPHAFTFVGGAVLPACSPERATILQMEARETESPNPGGWVDVAMEYAMSEAVEGGLAEAVLQAIEDHIDVILVPLPVLLALRGREFPVAFRGVRVADRLTKEAYADKFCV